MEMKDVDLLSLTCKLIYNIHGYFKREVKSKGSLIHFTKAQNTTSSADNSGTCDKEVSDNDLARE
jgi:hypothetical protein